LNNMPLFSPIKIMAAELEGLTPSPII